MLILLSCAKTMVPVSKQKAPGGSIPRFAGRAWEIAFRMSQFSVNELENLLKVNAKIALQNYQRFQHFHSPDEPSLQAILAYTGIVFKRLNPKDFTKEDFEYAQQHLRITSFCYGLLRPLDLIKNYRMEGEIRLPDTEGISMYEYWRPVLTDFFIDEIKRMGGILINLASEEMKLLFDWKKVESEVKVVTPEFRVKRGNKLTTIVIYTKMARGEMTRFILKNRIEDIEKLKEFVYEGFSFSSETSDESSYRFIMNA